MTQPGDLKLLLYQALAEPIGLLVEVSDFPRARQALYRARQEAQDPALRVLQLRSSPIPGGNLIIVKETVQVPGQAAPAQESSFP